VEESFTLSFLYKGVHTELSCHLRVSAYTYQFICVVGGHEIIMEKDDEGNIRVLDAAPFSDKFKKPDSEFIRAMVAEMQRVLQE